MGKSVKDIGKTKWQSLSSRQHHTAISKFAVLCIENSNFKDFINTYNKLLSWVQLDRYEPPKWVSEKEALELYFSFHQKLSGKEIGYFRENYKDNNLVWVPKRDITVVSDNVLTPYNIGSMIRLIDNFGFTKLVHNTNGLDISNSRLKRSAMGAEQWIPVEFVRNLPDYLSNSKGVSIALEKTDNSISLEEFIPPDEPFNIIVGNEAFGVSEEIVSICYQSVHIPMSGHKNSMNLSHAFAVFAYSINNGKN